MSNRSLGLAMAVAVLAGGCSGGSSGTSSGNQTANIIVTPSKSAVLANGSNSVVIHFEGAAKAPVTLQTKRGLFGAATTTQIDATSGDAVLVTCDASADTTCAGSDTVTVVDAALNSTQISITFTSLAACSTSCGLDVACAGKACTSASGAAGTCTGSPAACVTAACTATQSTETTCNDGIDNDCNGKIDCADAACDGQPCNAGSSTWTCKAGACSDTSSGYALQITPARTRLPADGTTSTTVTITVLAGTSPAAGVNLTLKADMGTLPASAQTGSDGTATVQYKAPSASGVATITAAVTAAPSASLSAKITMPAIGSLVAGGKTYDVMGVKTSGYQETNPISVEVLDDNGQPYPDGLVVEFDHLQLAGSTLSLPASPNSGSCTQAGQNISCTSLISSPADKPDSTGLASVVLNPGTAAGTLIVSATVTAAGQTRTFTFPGIPVVGAKASGSNFSIVCSPRNVPALAETNCSTSLIDSSFTCVALLKDRFGNLLGIPTSVTFNSEASAIGPQVAITPALDLTKDPASQASLGSAAQIFNTLGAALPLDVPPYLDGSEPSVVWAYDPCDMNPKAPTRVHNPRDGVVTVIAIADGEQGFVDLNGNGVYDDGEPFIDQGEPFIDANDNGKWDPGEWYLDLNGNNQYDPPISPSATPPPSWKANTKIWTQTIVVFTGQPMQYIADRFNPGNYLAVRWAPAGTGACTSTPAPVTPFAVTTSSPEASYTVVASDGNLNRLASTTAYSVAAEPPATIRTTYDGLPAYADDYGMFYRYWPCDQAGNCSNQCTALGTALLPAGTPSAAPCYMTPTISGFSCGIAANVMIAAGTAPDPATDYVDWNVDLTYPVYPATPKTVLDKLRVSGTSK
jgi:hypothetical protein